MRYEIIALARSGNRVGSSAYASTLDMAERFSVDVLRAAFRDGHKPTDVIIIDLGNGGALVRTRSVNGGWDPLPCHDPEHRNPAHAPRRGRKR